MSTTWNSRPAPALFRHWIEQVGGLAGSVYGRRMYEIMRYWDEDHPAWDAARTRLRRGVARPAEMGRVALVEVRRPQRHPCRGRPRGGGPRAEGPARGEIAVAGPAWREA